MSRRAVLITGATSGIGCASTLALRDAGFRVFGGYRNEAGRRQLAAQGVEGVRLDVTDGPQVEAARQSVERTLANDEFAGLLNNAGTAGGGPVELEPLAEYRRIMEVNFFGAVSVTRAFLPLLRRSRGRIVMMSSLAGVLATPLFGSYAASKFALEGFSDSLRREVGRHGVGVTIIEPGPVRTPIWDQVDNLDLGDWEASVYAEEIALRLDAARDSARTGLPPDTVAQAVLRALTARRPPIRMIVTGNRLKVGLARRLPAWLLDRLV